MAATARATARSRVSPRSSPCSQLEGEEGGHGHAGDHGQALAQPVELALQRGGLALGGAEHVGHRAHLGAHAGGGDLHLGPAPGDDGVHVGHAVAVAERPALGDAARLLGHRRGLAGEGGLVDLEAEGGEDPTVGRHPVAGLEQDHVAGHQGLGLDLDGAPVAPDPGRGHEHRAQGVEALLGLGLLHEPEHGVEQQHHGDDRGVLQVADRPGQHRRAEQHHTSRLRNWSTKIASRDRPGASARRLGPWLARRRSASSGLSPTARCGGRGRIGRRGADGGSRGGHGVSDRVAIEGLPRLRGGGLTGLEAGLTMRRLRGTPLLGPRDATRSRGRAHRAGGGRGRGDRQLLDLLGALGCGGGDLGPARRAGPHRYSMRRPEMARAITSCWICSVPSKMSKILASRCQRSTGYSRV